MAQGTDGNPGGGALGDDANAGHDGGDVVGVDGGTGAPGSIDGLAVADLGGAAPVKRGRGRPPGSGKSGTKSGSGSTVAQAKAAPATVVGIEALLLGLHSIASSLTKVEEIALDKSEANQLAQALAAVNVHYQKTVDPKLIAWMGVVAVAGQVYGPRVLAYRLRAATEKAQRQQAPRMASNGNASPAAPVVQRAPAPAMMDAVSDPSFVSTVQ